jgi:hypothetical protein
MADLKYPEWQRQYKAVLLEFDPSRLRELVAAAEDAIFVRFQALSLSPSGEDERQAIVDAVNDLYAIKRDMLKFPGLDFDQSKAIQELSGLD